VWLGVRLRLGTFFRLPTVSYRRTVIRDTCYFLYLVQYLLIPDT
jgi:hypothetical protein